jgi:hypothetical protein
LNGPKEPLSFPSEVNVHINLKPWNGPKEPLSFPSEVNVHNIQV